MISMTDGAEALVLSFLIPVLQTEWNLTDTQQSVLGSSTFVGFFIGCLLSGQVADRVGRRKPLLYGVFFNFFFGLISGFAQNFQSLAILRLLFGISVGIISPLSATYISEVTPMKIRGRVLVFTGAFFTIGEMITCLIAVIFLDTFSSGNWRALVMWSALPGIFTFLLVYFFLEESPRYLLVFQKYDEAFRHINNIIKRNNKSNCQALSQEEKDDLRRWADKQASFQQNKTSANPKDLFREGRNKITPFLWVMWYVLSCVYYGNIFILPTILRDMNLDNKAASSTEFLDVFFSVLSELPSSFISYYIIEVHFLGRKNSLIITFAFTSIACFIAFGSIGSSFLVFATLARFFLNMAFSIIYPFTTEIYPTTIRATGLGIASSFSRIGGMTMPWISIASLKIGITGPFLIYGLLAATATICSILLPFDTTGIELDKHHEEDECSDPVEEKEGI